MAETVILIKQMLILFLMALIGMIAYKKNVIDEASCKRLSGIIVNIANPALILSSVLDNDGSVMAGDLFLTFFSGIILYTVLVLSAGIWPRLLRAPREQYGTYKVMMIFTNVGFMGFPIMDAVWGSNALLIGTMLLLPFNVLIYTYGVWCLQSDSAGTAHKEKKDTWKLILNNGVIACALAFLIFCFRIEVPEVIASTVQKISAITAPISMMVIGASFATLKARELFSDVKLFVLSFFKLFVMPIGGTVLFAAALKICGIDIHKEMIQLMIHVIMILLATPIGSMTVMLAQEYDGDLKLTSKGVALTTLLSILTIPVVSGIVNHILDFL